MKNTITKLSPQVINQIAAGEVVENPASIVKELVENSLDAGAKEIIVTTQDGGFTSIQVEDDGFGMSEADARCCVERHATSKIHNIEDLDALSTMGFRGEALAAISSVSLFEIKTSDGAGATRVIADGGVVSNSEPCARNRGTSITIRSLFYNVPARKKFQKSVGSNTAAIKRTIETLALAHEDVTFTLNGKTFYPTSRKNRVQEILGDVEIEVRGKNVTGYCASPQRASGKRLSQYVFINRRPIFSPLIAKAVKMGFSTRIGEHEYPRFVLFLEVAPDSVDVNVHPQKKEARFKDEDAIFRLVQKAVERAFIQDLPFEKEISFTPTTTSFSESFPSLPFKVEEEDLDFIYTDRALGVFGNYLLLQKEGLVLVDLRAAFARVLFESLTPDKSQCQELMFPVEVPLERGDEEKAEELSKLGIECRILPRLLVVDALPLFLEPGQFPEFFKNFKAEKRLDRAAINFCRNTKKQFSLAEANALWSQLKKCQDKMFDPLGNRIFVELKQEDFAKLLLRGNSCIKPE